MVSHSTRKMKQKKCLKIPINRTKTRALKNNPMVGKPREKLISHRYCSHNYLYSTWALFFFFLSTVIRVSHTEFWNP
ncbi:hypothetical protein LINPERPRIM_LOCUS7681 [Linum perenne]